jgi:hypothetical protein
MSTDANIPPRQLFLDALKERGEDCHAAGKDRLAIIHDPDIANDSMFEFSEEFTIEVGETIKRWECETDYTVTHTHPNARAGTFVSFQVTAAEPN